jgi:hypothetical protein
MDNDIAPSQRLSDYIHEVEISTKRPVIYSPYPNATQNDDIHAALEIGPTISAVIIHFRPLRPLSDPITEKSVAHELTHALMVYAWGYPIPCAPPEVPEYSVQTAAEIVDLIDDVIVDTMIHKRGFSIDTPEQMKALENNLAVMEAADNRSQINPYEKDPVRAEIHFVSLFIHTWALPRYVKLQPQAFNLFRRFANRFPKVLKSEFSKAGAIKKSFQANDIFTLDGRTQSVISALSLWPVDDRIYLAPISPV